MFDFITASMFEPIFTGLKEILVIVAVPVITWIGITKGWSFAKSQIKGA